MTKTDLHVVYWMEDGKPQARPCFDLSEVLRVSEELRKLRRGGYPITLITSKSEYADMVGQDGVDVTGPDYDWKKRRP
jgi:hypothetical protein